MSRIIVELEKDELRQLIEEAVHKVIQSTAPKPKTEQIPEILNVDQVCQLLNMKKATLYQYTHKSKIPFSKKGKALYFSRKEILAWLLEGRNLTEQEQEDVADLMLLQANRKRMYRLNKVS